MTPDGTPTHAPPDEPATPPGPVRTPRSGPGTAPALTYLHAIALMLFPWGGVGRRQATSRGPVRAPTIGPALRAVGAVFVYYIVLAIMLAPFVVTFLAIIGVISWSEFAGGGGG